MTNIEIAESHLRQARLILDEAEHHLRGDRWNLVVRRSQESVELGLKGLLRVAGVEVPHVHDVGVLLREHGAQLPSGFVKNLDRVVSISRRLRKERETSFYGDDELGAPAEQLYVRQDGEDAFRDARFVLDLCESSFPRRAG